MIVPRYDPLGDYITVFDTESGNKIRFSLNDKAKAPTKAFAPELADISLTDFCPFSCEFCYRDSTIYGRHSTLENIVTIADALAKVKVFEVALGGGEPTFHPHFTEIMRIFRSRGIVPNFTTRNKRWQEDHPEVLSLMGGFAVSVDGAWDVRELDTILAGYPLETGQVNLHVVMGTVTRENFSGILFAAREAGFRVTLLGYKMTGRGPQVKPISYDWWLDDILTFDGLAISIDTALAEQFQQQILDAGIPQVMFHTEEGKFSVFIDAVTMKLGPSSYHGESTLVDFNHETWLEAFKEF